MFSRAILAAAATAAAILATTPVPVAAGDTTTLACQFGRLAPMTLKTRVGRPEGALRVGAGKPIPMSVGSGSDAMMSADAADGTSYVFYIHDNPNLTLIAPDGRSTTYKGNCTLL